LRHAGLPVTITGAHRRGASRAQFCPRGQADRGAGRVALELGDQDERTGVQAELVHEVHFTSPHLSGHAGPSVCVGSRPITPQETPSSLGCPVRLNPFYDAVPTVCWRGWDGESWDYGAAKPDTTHCAIRDYWTCEAERTSRAMRSQIPAESVPGTLVSLRAIKWTQRPLQAIT